MTSAGNKTSHEKYFGWPIISHKQFILITIIIIIIIIVPFDLNTSGHTSFSYPLKTDMQEFLDSGRKCWTLDSGC